ncbi:MAG: aminoacyl-tRNA hydrolase [bacterium]
MIKLIVGLGNPGRKYEATRHNLGFMVVDAYLAKKRGRITEEKTNYHLATLRVKGEHLHVAKPQTYMNLSGEAVLTLANRFELLPKEILVICDDFALPFGKLRLRANGSDGGHNGLASIVEELGSSQFPRLRMGVGPCPEGVPFEDFVLQEFAQEELDNLAEFLKLGVSCLEFALYRGIAAAMNKFN